MNKDDSSLAERLLLTFPSQSDPALRTESESDEISAYTDDGVSGGNDAQDYSAIPGSRAYYVQEAKRLGVTGVTRKTKAELVAAVNQANEGNAGRRVRGPKAADAAAQTTAPNPERRSMGPRLDAAPIQNRIRRMSSAGATPEQIAAFLNGINF